MKYNKEARAAAGRKCSRASLILLSVTLASFTCSQGEQTETVMIRMNQHRHADTPGPSAS